MKNYLLRGLREIEDWAIDHPFKALAWLALFMALTVAGLVLDDVRDLILVLVGLAAAYGAWCWSFSRDNHKLVVVALIGVMAMNEPVRAAPLVIGGIVVVGVGIFVGVKIVKRCRRIAAAKTNAWPEELVASPTYGAFFPYAEECVYEIESGPPVAFTLAIAVESVESATVTVSASTGTNFVQSWKEFTDGEAASHGLSIAAGPAFSRNGQPVPAELVPLTFDEATRTVTHGAGGILVTVHRSTDLNEWETLASLNVEAGTRLTVDDASSGASFYKVTTK